MKIVLAPDSFKGSLPALSVCEAMRDGAKKAMPHAELVLLPVADGGEGTTVTLTTALSGELRSVSATGPLPQAGLVQGELGLVSGGRTAILEMASASGLPLVPPEKRNPLHTTSRGTGELIRAALDAGARELVIGIGGSATTDLGGGMLQALGIRFFREDDTEITEPITGALLGEVARVDASELHPAVRESRILVACDVDNPLLGPDGCAAVYGPQKGATPDIVLALERNLTKAAFAIERAAGRSVRNEPGAGAAGGLGAAMLALLDARLRPGIELVLDVLRFDEALSGADLVLTGEGRLDGQSARGKVVSGISRRAQKAGVPVVALAGQVDEAVDNLYSVGLTSAFSIVPGPASLEESMRRAPEWIRLATERILRVWSQSRKVESRSADAAR